MNYINQAYNSKAVKFLRFYISSIICGRKSLIGNVYSKFYCRKNRIIRSFNICKNDSKKSISSNKNLSDKTIYLFTVAMNNDKLIELQYKQLKKYLEDHFVYTIIDNSTDNSKSKIIEKYCLKNKIPYAKVERPLINSPSENHGCVLNYIYYKFILGQPIQYFGFIDHDIIPVKKFNILDKISNRPFYGRVKQEDYSLGEKKRYYIQPIYCFYNTNYINNLKINFMTNKLLYLDTGGANYLPLYKKYFKDNPDKITDFASYKLLSSDKEKYKFTTSMKNGAAKTNMSGFELYDKAWLHLGNASNYLKIKSQNYRLKKFFETLG